ncbi:hypothetical protein GYMLUDRAFT_851474 [Collybiopsis luxurians FD-317 M1]|nr:hypothetical protein GYMLUDRAFT_851474 [Collybiopsis luxurians FD-317 M1]
MLAFSLRQSRYATVSISRVIAIRRSVSSSPPNLAEAVAANQAPSTGDFIHSPPRSSAKTQSSVSAKGRRKPSLQKYGAPTPLVSSPTTSTKRRPQISQLQPRKWNRPIAEGVLPAYDEALKIIMRDSEELTLEAGKLWKEITQLEARAQVEEAEGHSEALQNTLSHLETLRKKHHIVSVQSQINLPSTRWTVANAQFDPTIPAHRHLAEQRWRGEGALDLLMERLHQMHIIPDLLPGIHPSLDLHVTVPYPLHKQFKRSVKSGGKSTLGVEPGSFLSPTQTARAPGLWAHCWHLDVRLYTMVMLDPDVPDEENQSFTTYLHWMKPNIPISALTLPRGHIPFSLLNSHTAYIPPHPQQGTPYHRYTILLLPQPAKSQYSLNTEARFLSDIRRHKEESGAIPGFKKLSLETPETSSNVQFSADNLDITQLDKSAPASWPAHTLRKYTTSKWLDIPVVPDSQRRGFNLREFIRKWGLSGRDNITLEDVASGGHSGQSLRGLRTQVNGGKGVGRNDAAVIGGGAHMFREVWDESVSGVFDALLEGSEERYALPKKVDPYESLKGIRKYF